jgi:hypothetical protein
VSRFEKPADFVSAYPHAAPGVPTLQTLGLLALLVYAAGFLILYPIVENSVTESVSEGNDPALLQFVAP